MQCLFLKNDKRFAMIFIRKGKIKTSAGLVFYVEHEQKKKNSSIQRNRQIIHPMSCGPASRTPRQQVCSVQGQKETESQPCNYRLPLVYMLFSILPTGNMDITPRSSSLPDYSLVIRYVSKQLSILTVYLHKHNKDQKVNQADIKKKSWTLVNR